MKQLALASYLRRTANTALAARDLLSPSARMMSRPFAFHIEVNNYCNLKCTHCPRHSATADINSARWTEEMFDRIMPWMRWAGFVGLAGLGEPFLEKNLPRILRQIVDAGPAPAVITNGTMIRADVIEQIVGVGPMLINVSIDGATKDTFERIRVGADFDRIIDNMLALREAKERLGTVHPAIQINWAWTRSNLHEVEELARLAEQMGALAVRTQPVYTVDLPLAAREAVTNEEVDEALANLRRVLKPTIQLVNSPLNSTLAIAPLPIGGNGNAPANGRYFCPNIWRTIHLGTRGNVRVCCMGGFEDIGNIMEQPLDEIWNSEPMRRLRQSLLDGKPPQACRRCYLLKHHSRHEALDVLKEYREALHLHNLLR